MMTHETNDPPYPKHETFEDMIDARYADARDVMIERHKKYGPNNIGRSGLFGVVVRLGDKFARLENGVLHGNIEDADTSDETVRDTLIDLLNYAAIGLCVLDGEWTRETCPPLYGSSS